MPKFTLQNRIITYQVRHSRRARYISLRFSPIGLTVVLPQHLRLNTQAIEELLQKKESWILNALDRLSVYSPKSTLGEGDEILFLGQPYRLSLQHAPGKKGAKVVGKTDDQIFVQVGTDATPTSALEKWYRQHAEVYIAERTAVLAHHFGFEYQKVSIRNQKTRLGSCSNRGNLNFNWRLIIAPPEVIDYIIIHELCHLREMNHSPRFWGWVAHLCPQYKHHQQWIKDHSQYLFLY